MLICQRPDGLPVGTCNICGMTYVAEAPSMENLGGFYREYNQFKNYNGQIQPGWLNPREQRRRSRSSDS